MSRTRGRDTRCELDLRSELHRRGLRYRVHYPVPGHPRRRIDISFCRLKIAVFVDGCFWHSCPMHASWPASNAEWWAEKIKSNVARDRQTDVFLTEAGWTVIRAWEHENFLAVADRIEEVILSRRRPLIPPC
nr:MULTISPECIES: very short patch repair endonuclease [Frankia]